MKINGCTAIVTGGASGLGEACARALVGEKARVAIYDLAEEAGEKVAKDLGNDAVFYKIDLTDEVAVQEGISRTTQHFGAIQVVVNCAGVLSPAKVLGKNGPMPMDIFRRVMETNVMGTMNVIRFALQGMVKNEPNDDGERGVIINTASIAAFEGQPGQAAYSASKGALVAMTLQLSREFANFGIRVMTIAPGMFDTPMIAKLPDKAKEVLNRTLQFPKRMGKPHDFAELAKHIIVNPMLNGEIIRLDGAVRMPAG